MQKIQKTERKWRDFKWSSVHQTITTWDYYFLLLVNL